VLGRGEKCIQTSLGRPRRGWEYNIIVDLEEIVWSVWTGFIRLRIGISDGKGKDIPVP
jgi:hypothetical protein